MRFRRSTRPLPAISSSIAVFLDQSSSKSIRNTRVQRLGFYLRASSCLLGDPRVEEKHWFFTGIEKLMLYEYSRFAEASVTRDKILRVVQASIPSNWLTGDEQEKCLSCSWGGLDWYLIKMIARETRLLKRSLPGRRGFKI